MHHILKYNFAYLCKTVVHISYAINLIVKVYIVPVNIALDVVVVVVLVIVISHIQYLSSEYFLPTT